MSIYERKNSKGQPTGLYVMELTIKGTKHKESSRDLESLTARQTAILAGVIPAGPSRLPTGFLGGSRPYTVGDLRRDALVVWKTGKDKDTSIRRFETVCDILGLDTPLASVRKLQLLRVVSELEKREFQGRPMADDTVHRYLAAFSGGMSWAVECDLLAGRPNFPWPKAGKGNKTVLTEENEPRVIQRLADVGARDIALMMDVLLATGARVSEVLKLTPERVNVRAGEVTFPDTKNGEDRTVFIAKDLAAKLLEMILAGMPSYYRVRKQMTKARKHLKIADKVTPHVLRHTVGTRLDAQGVSLATIGKQLGHKNLETTMRYIHPDRKALKEVSQLLARSPKT